MQIQSPSPHRQLVSLQSHAKLHPSVTPRLTTGCSPPSTEPFLRPIRPITILPSTFLLFTTKCNAQPTVISLMSP